MIKIRMRRRPSSMETGQALVVVALMLPVLLGFVGLAVDYGRMAAARRQLQSDADAAALAGAQDLPYSSANAWDSAKADATTSLINNQYSGTGNDAAPVFTPGRTYTTNSEPPDTITVDLSRTVDTAFLGILGLGSRNVSAEGKAVVYGISSCADGPGGICIPYLGWDTVTSACIPIQTGDIIIFRDNQWVGDTSAGSCQWSGNSDNFKGYLRPSGGSSLSTGTTQITSKGGNACGQEPVSEVQDAFNNHTDVVIPVASTESGNGSNLNVNIVHFITISLHFTYWYPGQEQVVTLAGGPTGGTFTLSFTVPNSSPPKVETTASIQYDASSADVEAALAALPDIGSGNVAVTGAVGGPFTVAFQGDLGNQSLPTMTEVSNLTGGSSSSVDVTALSTTLDNSRYGTSSVVGDYNCPATWYGEIVDAPTGRGYTGGIITKSACLTTPPDCAPPQLLPTSN